MSIPKDEAKSGSLESDVDLRGLTSLPTRLALASLYATPIQWALLFVVLPVATGVASVLLEAQFASGVVPICGFLLLILWSIGYYQFARMHVAVDGRAKTVSITSGTSDVPAGRRTVTIPLESVERVSAHPIGDVGLVRIDDRITGLVDRIATPSAFVVSSDRLPAVIGALRTAGVSIGQGSSIDGSTRDELRTPRWRFVGTAIGLVGVPVMVLVVFGPAVLLTNGTVVVVALSIVAVLRELLSGS